MRKTSNSICYKAYVDINGQYFCMACGGREKGVKRNIVHAKNCSCRGMKYCQQTKTRKTKKSRKTRTRKSRR
uniref:Uncharacterized protein n=1 Tax=viral metagenome TaxID=1070528 RepID=A0A6C0B9E5_9ZZZZ